MSTIASLKNKRSTPYPSVPLEKALELVSQVYEKLGEYPANRETIVRALGYSSVSGASASKVGSLVQYGLLERSGSKYKISDASIKYLKPNSTEDEFNSKNQAFLTPDVFSYIYTSYKGKPLPKFLANIVRNSGQFSFTDRVSEKVVDLFKQNAEYLGIMKNGIILGSEELSSKDEIETKIKKEEVVTKDRPTRNLDSFGKYSYNLPSGILISIPRKFEYGILQGIFKDGVDEIEKAALKLGIKEEIGGAEVD